MVRRFKRTGKRNEVFLATKFGFTGKPERLIRGDPEYVKEAMDRSLKRLGGGSTLAWCSQRNGRLTSPAVDSVDLYYLHRIDPDTPLEESIPALASLRDAGKTKSTRPRPSPQFRQAAESRPSFWQL